MIAGRQKAGAPRCSTFVLHPFQYEPFARPAGRRRHPHRQPVGQGSGDQPHRPPDGGRIRPRAAGPGADSVTRECPRGRLRRGKAQPEIARAARPGDSRVGFFPGADRRERRQGRRRGALRVAVGVRPSSGGRPGGSAGLLRGAGTRRTPGASPRGLARGGGGSLHPFCPARAAVAGAEHGAGQVPRGVGQHSGSPQPLVAAGVYRLPGNGVVSGWSDACAPGLGRWCRVGSSSSQPLYNGGKA